MPGRLPLHHQEWIYLERKLLCETSFRFANKRDPVSYVAALAADMHLFPPELILAGSCLLFEDGPEAINDILSRMVPENMMLVVMHKSLKNKTDKVSICSRL